MNIHKVIQVSLIRLTMVRDVITSGGHIIKVAAGVLFLFTAPIAVFASNGAGTIGSGRLLPSIAMLAGLTGVIIGRKALKRVRHTGGGRSGAIIAMVLGLISLSIGSLHAANSAGSFGTGNGLAGAFVALGLGLVAILFGGIALARLRRVAHSKTSEEIFKR